MLPCVVICECSQKDVRRMLACWPKRSQSPHEYFAPGKTFPTAISNTDHDLCMLFVFVFCVREGVGGGWSQQAAEFQWSPEPEGKKSLDGRQLRYQRWGIRGPRGSKYFSMTASLQV